MAFNNPLIPGDPFSYDLKWIVKKIKQYGADLSGLDERIQQAIIESLDQHDPIYFKTAAELIASPQTDYSLAYIEGYYEEGDGGANLYYVTSDYNDVLGANFYLTLTGTNRWAIPILTTPYVTPEMFGATGDGSTDDTAAIKTALHYDRELLLAKIYAVTNRQADCIKIPSNRTITFLQGSALKAINANLASSSIISIENASNVVVNYPHLIGDADENTDTSEGAGHLIVIRDSNNVKVNGAYLEKAHTDAIYCIRVENVRVSQATILNTGRNAFTLTAGRDVEFCNSLIDMTYRVAPKAGISIEPNYDSDYIETVMIHDITIKNTQGLAFYANINKFVNPHNVSVFFRNIRTYDCGSAVAAFSAQPEAGNTGLIKVQGVYACRTAFNLFLTRVHANNGVLLYLKDCRSVQSNLSGSTQPARLVLSTEGALTNYGNYHIDNVQDEIPEKSRLFISSPLNVKVENSNTDQLSGVTNSDITYIGEFPNAVLQASPGTHTLVYREFYATTAGGYAIRTNIKKGVHCKFHSVTGGYIQFSGATIYKKDGTTFNTMTATADDAFAEVEWFDTNKAILKASNGAWTVS